MRTLPLAVAALLLAGAVGCARPTAAPPSTVPPPDPRPTDPRPTATPAPLVPDGYAGRFQITAAVLANDRHGPQLCTMLALSLPPQCGGPDVVGWTWDGLRHGSTSGTTWGTYRIVGTFAAGKFTLTEPAKDSDGNAGPNRPTPDFTSPCPAPAGGWRPVDPAKATGDTLNTITGMANADPDFGGLWIDQQPPPSGASPMSDPTKLVLNVRFVGDLERHEREIRQVWGGALCLTAAKRSMAELTRIQQEFTNEPGMTESSIDVITGTIHMGVFVATQARQRELDATYGPGLVTLSGALQPIDL